MLVKWDPFKELERTIQWWSMQPFRRPLWDDRNEGVREWAPAVNVYEDKDQWFLEAQLPGLEMKDVDISVKDNILELRGERKAEHEKTKEGYHLREAAHGKFARTFRLPPYVNADEAKATYDRGVLTISVPKEERVKPRVIPIEAK